MPLVAHLVELRNRLFWVVGTLAVAFGGPRTPVLVGLCWATALALAVVPMVGARETVIDGEKKGNYWASFKEPPPPRGWAWHGARPVSGGTLWRK